MMMWNLWQKDGTFLDALSGHKEIIRNLSVNSDGKKIATASDDGTIKLWPTG